jgi:hypothetical protein
MLRRTTGALSALTIAAMAAVAAPAIASSPDGPTDKRHRSERLVVRGTDTVTELGCDASDVCKMALTNGTFRGTPVGSGAYDGRLMHDVGARMTLGRCTTT